MAGDDDNETIGGGGDRAIAKLLEPEVPSLARFVRLLVGDAAYVEDVVQETLVQALMSFGRYDPARPVGAWLRGIALHVVHRYWRRIRRGAKAEAVLARAVADDAPGASPEDDLAVREHADLLYRAMDALSPRLREALVLCCCEGLSAEEAARQTGSPVGTVYARVNRAREGVRKFVAAETLRRSRAGGSRP